VQTDRVTFLKETRGDVRKSYAKRRRQLLDEGKKTCTAGPKAKIDRAFSIRRRSEGFFGAGPREKGKGEDNPFA